MKRRGFLGALLLPLFSARTHSRRVVAEAGIWNSIPALKIADCVVPATRIAANTVWLLDAPYNFVWRGHFQLRGEYRTATSTNLVVNANVAP